MGTRMHYPKVGDIYGENTVISENVIRKDGKICFEVKCSCGRIGFKQAKALKNGKSTRCKSCSSKKTFSEYPLPVNFKNIGGLGATFFGSIRDGAIKRGYEFSITQQYLWTLLEDQQFRCALSGMPINLSLLIKKSNPDYSKFTASVDRINNDLGYIEGNVQWVHKDVNRMKWKWTEEYFVYICRMVSNNQ